MDGEKIFDRKEDGGFPDLSKVNELKMTIAEKIFEVGIVQIKEIPPTM